MELLSPSEVFLCSIVKAELWHGATKYGNVARRLTILQNLFSPYVSLPFDDRAARTYANGRHALEQKGNVIGPFDLMIAAIAESNSLTLVTHNASEFSRFPNLSIEDWER